MREEVEVVDRIRLRDADVGSWPLEPGEAPGGVADAADASGPKRLT